MEDITLLTIDKDNKNEYKNVLMDLMKKSDEYQSNLNKNYFPDFFNEETDYKSYLDFIVRNKEIVYLIMKTDTPIGYVNCTKSSYSENSISVKDVYIDNSFRGKGIGSFIMDLLEKELKKKYTSIKYIVLNCMEKNIKARKFYEDLKFKPFTTTFIKKL